MNRQPLVSVLMNCFNGEKYLREAIDSIVAQSYANWEIVFWDNQSTDASREICQSYRDERIRYFFAPQHTNLGGARDCALRQAKGDFVAVLDTDDLWMPDKLEKQMPVFDDPGVGIVISDTVFFTDEGQTRQLFQKSLPPQGFVFDALLENYYVSLETVVIRRSAIETLSHAFDPHLSHISDFDLIVRLSKDWKLICVGEMLAKWRVHPSSASWTEPGKFYEEKLKFICKMDRLPEYQGAWRRARQSFVRSTEVSEAIVWLVNGDRSVCRGLLSRHVFSSWKAAFVFGLSWLPYGDRLLLAYRQKKTMV